MLVHGASLLPFDTTIHVSSSRGSHHDMGHCHRCHGGRAHQVHAAPFHGASCPHVDDMDGRPVALLVCSGTLLRVSRLYVGDDARSGARIGVYAHERRDSRAPVWVRKHLLQRVGCVQLVHHAQQNSVAHTSMSVNGRRRWCARRLWRHAPLHRIESYPFSSYLIPTYFFFLKRI